jgi:hypothetical protein
MRPSPPDIGREGLTASFLGGLIPRERETATACPHVKRGAVTASSDYHPTAVLLRAPKYIRGRRLVFQRRGPRLDAPSAPTFSPFSSQHPGLLLARDWHSRSVPRHLVSRAVGYLNALQTSFSLAGHLAALAGFPAARPSACILRGTGLAQGRPARLPKNQ